MKKKFKKLILIDLDGVLNKYVGKYEENEVPEPQEELANFLENLTTDYELKLFTSRNKLLAAKWLVANNSDKYFEDVTNIKEPAWLIIDDRCLKFDGSYDTLLKHIKELKPWYKN